MYSYIILFYLEYLSLSSIIWRGILWPEATDSQRGTLAGGGIQFDYNLVLPILPNFLQGDLPYAYLSYRIVGLPARKPEWDPAHWETTCRRSYRPETEE